MRVTSTERLMEFSRRHPDARRALGAWLKLTNMAEWRSLAEVHQTYPQADGVRIAGGRVVTVFNIRGNNYRLLTTIDYRLGAVNVVDALTHAEYDKQKWKRL